MAPPDYTEARYREGMARWADRDLGAARAELEEALAQSAGPEEDQWWFATTRALAQIAMESDDLTAADQHLRFLPGHAVGNAQQTALRAKQRLLSGEADAAALEVAVAVGALHAEPEDDVGSLMNGALALVWCAEVLVELGFGAEADRLVAEGRQRMVQAGVHDPTFVAMHDLVEAGAARLTGDRPRAEARLATASTDLDPELPLRAGRERARLLWDAGQTAAAQDLYDRTGRAAAMIGLESTRRLLASERSSGPPTSRTDELPVEQWAERLLAEALESHVPYAVVLCMVLDDDPDRILELNERIEAHLYDHQHLGTVDGTGSDGEILELFVDGPDPDALWAALEPMVTAAQPGPGSSVTLRDDRSGGTRSFALG